MEVGMSMWMTLAPVSPEAFAKIKARPELLEGLFDSDEDVLGELGIAGSDITGFDYRIADEALEAMAEVDGSGDEEGDRVFADLGVDGDLDYDGGYGPAVYLEPKSVKKALKDSFPPGLDDDVKAMMTKAVKAGSYVVGMIR